MLTGGMTFSPLRGPLQVRQVTMTWYLKHFGELKEVRLKSLAVMIAQTLLFFVHIPTVLVRIRFEASYPVIVILVTITFGQTINVLEAVQCVTEARISLQKASAKHTVVAIFKAATTLVSGVSGILVMPQWWWLEEEVVGVAGQITESGSRKMKKEHLYIQLNMSMILEMMPDLTPLPLTHWMFGFVKQKTIIGRNVVHSPFLLCTFT